MLQKTFEIRTKEDALRVVEKLQGIVTGPSCKMLMKTLVFQYTYDQAKDIISPLPDAFPDMTVSGLSVFMLQAPDDDNGVPVSNDEPLIRVSFFIFENTDIIQVTYDLNERSREDILKSIRERIDSTHDVKGVCVSMSGFMAYISPFLEKLTDGFEEIPFFGTMASGYFSTKINQNVNPFFFDREGKHEYGFTFLLFVGADLNIDVQYIFGWKPIGKFMPIVVSDEKLAAGDTMVSLIDGQKPEDIYKKYLGAGFDEYVMHNSCEFPISVERDRLLIGRTPFSYNEKGEIIYIGSVRPDEKIRFTYTVKDELLSNTDMRSRSFADFEAQAIELFVCGNRGVFLKEDAKLETKCFRRIVPDTLQCSAAGEIYYHKGKGEFLNSALIAVGYREGEKQNKEKPEFQPIYSLSEESRIIPLQDRLSRFMKSMNGDLVSFANKAEQANHTKSAFLATMSHEIRTPINAILGMDEMILRETDDKEIHAYAADIMSAGKTLLSLINDILDISKIEEGKMEIIPVEYDLSSLINDIINMIRDRADAKGLILDYEVNEHIPHILFGDENRIRQCVTNILTNAVKYTEKGSVELIVDYTDLEDSIKLSFTVIDTGIGMKQESIEKLFSPYQRIEEERNRSIEGTGLGMSITKHLLDLMGGELKVNSVYGKGSRFSFSVEQKVVDREEIGNITQRLERLKDTVYDYRELFHAPEAEILVVDDNPVNMTVIKNLLKKTGIQIDTAASGREAFIKASKKKYDICFIDHMMPEMDGIETLERIRRVGENQETPAVALTANAVAGAKEMYLEKGFTDYLSKPMDGTKLEKMIIKLLPDEKVLAPDETVSAGPVDEGKAEEKVRTKYDRVPRWLYSVPGLFPDDGIMYNASEEGFMEILESFYDTVDDTIAAIEDTRSRGDIKEYTVRVHGLKSSARLIGANPLSDQALDLEMAGNEEDVEFINSHTGKLIADLKQLADNISKLY
ncbi:MAG: response regulator [Eubacterium sp.]|nr:response regulator [Eubacterium sp.]